MSISFNVSKQGQQFWLRGKHRFRVERRRFLWCGFASRQEVG
jgi:hypothetical protein